MVWNLIRKISDFDSPRYTFRSTVATLIKVLTNQCPGTEEGGQPCTGKRNLRNLLRGSIGEYIMIIMVELERIQNKKSFRTIIMGHGKGLLLRFVNVLSCVLSVTWVAKNLHNGGK